MSDPLFEEKYARKVMQTREALGEAYASRDTNKINRAHRNSEAAWEAYNRCREGRAYGHDDALRGK